MAQDLPPQSVLPDPVLHLAPRPRTVVRLPKLTDEQKAFLTVLFVASVLAAALVLLALGLIRGYQNYTNRAQIERASQHNERGVALADQGRLTEAIAEFDAALQLARDTPQERGIAENLASAHIAAGLQSYNAGSFLPAATSFEAAAQANPDNPQSWLWLGNTRSRLGQQGAAVNAWRASIEAAPNNAAAADARVNIGLFYIQRGDEQARVQDYSGARGWYEEARRIASATVVEAQANERIRRLPGW